MNDLANRVLKDAHPHAVYYRGTVALVQLGRLTSQQVATVGKVLVDDRFIGVVLQIAQQKFVNEGPAAFNQAVVDALKQATFNW